MNTNIRRYLNLPEDNAALYLYIILPETALANQGVLDWIQANEPRGCQSYQYGDSIILQINNLGRKILTNDILDAAIDDHGATLKGLPCVAVEVDTVTLDAYVPVGYSPNGQIYDEDGEVLRQKTVDELMICIRGTEGKSIIKCVERVNGKNGNPDGIQMDQLLRFRTQFAAYYVYSDEQLAAWKVANVVE